MNRLRHFIPALLALGLCSFARAAEPAAKLDFTLLKKSIYRQGIPAFPEELRNLENKRVRVTGFVSPFDDPDNMTKLMLTGEALGCFYCNPPAENGVVFVRFPKSSKPLKWESDTIVVEGVLHLMGNKHNDEESKLFLFTIDDAVMISKK